MGYKSIKIIPLMISHSSIININAISMYAHFPINNIEIVLNNACLEGLVIGSLGNSQ
jgi:hypothetical protein